VFFEEFGTRPTIGRIVDLGLPRSAFPYPLLPRPPVIKRGRVGGLDGASCGLTWQVSRTVDNLTLTTRECCATHADHSLYILQSELDRES